MDDNERRLIEDYLPIQAISAEASREKNIHNILGPNARTKRIDERMARETPALVSVKPTTRIATSIPLYSFGSLRHEVGQAASLSDETLPPGVTEAWFFRI